MTGQHMCWFQGAKALWVPQYIFIGIWDPLLLELGTEQHCATSHVCGVSTSHWGPSMCFRRWCLCWPVKKSFKQLRRPVSIKKKSPEEILKIKSNYDFRITARSVFCSMGPMAINAQLLVDACCASVTLAGRQRTLFLWLVSVNKLGYKGFCGL